MKYELTRDVSVTKCHWLDTNMKKGTMVYKYYGATYGCVSPYGVACTTEKGKTPFFELPRTALKEI
jgi:hypothetical protein